MRFWGGIIGWAAFGPIGGLIGYFIGYFSDKLLKSERLESSGTRQASYSTRNAGVQRNSFLMSLLVLSSAVIKADGKLLQSELDYVRDFIRRNFGEEMVADAMKALDELNGKTVDIYQVGTQIALNMNYSQRLQLFHYLVELAHADGDLCAKEKSVLEAIASAIRVTSADADSVISMYFRDTDSAYKVLEISPSASDEEVKLAYRRMAMKHHPDKVATLGEDVQKAAAEKFRKVKDAYEAIKAERGMA